MFHGIFRRALMEERREYPRRKLNCPALFKGGIHACDSVRIRDISRGGLFVETLNPADYGENVLINIDWQHLFRDVSIKGKVVRSVPEYGMGIMITFTTSDDYLREWITR
jgi:hypothetical protein